jgi:hypothetical protein
MFTPVDGRQGRTAEDLFCGAPMVLVLGGGFLGHSVVKLLRRQLGPNQSIAVADISPALVGADLDGIMVQSIEDILQTIEVEDLRVIYCSFELLTEFERACGLRRPLIAENHVFSLRSLQRPEAVLELTDDLLFSKPIPARLPRMMPVAQAQEILSKLSLEYPQLFKIDLSGWADPIRHPGLTEIIASIPSTVACSITTRLMGDERDVRRLVEVPPTLITVNPTMSGGALSGEALGVFHRNLTTAVTLLRSQVMTSHFRIQVDEYASNLSTVEFIVKTAEHLDVRVVRSRGYVNPYDTVLSHLEADGSLKDPRFANLVWDFDDYLMRAREVQSSPCLCRRIFPVIRFDGVVRNCHLYTELDLNEIYTITNPQNLQSKRADNLGCRRCQAQGLHRLDVDNLDLKRSLKN